VIMPGRISERQTEVLAQVESKYERKGEWT
jgi:hypothetical protein